MYVSHLKACTFASQTARAQCRYTAFMSYFRQWVGLIHKLAQLAGAEEFFNRGRNRFRIDQVMRHQVLRFCLVQTLFNCTFYTSQTAAELVFSQLTHRTNTTITQVVNIVYFTMTVTQFNQCSNGSNDVFNAQNVTAFFRCTSQSFVQQTAIPRVLLCFRQFLLVCARIKFHTAYARQIIAVFTEEQAVEELLNSFFGRRFARTHHAVNRYACSLLISSFVCTQSAGDVTALIQFVDIKGRNFFYTMDIKFGQQFFCNFIVSRSQYFTGFRINQVSSQCFAYQAFWLYIQTSQACIGNITDIFRSNAFTFGNQYIAFFIQDINFSSFTFQTACNQISLDTV